MLGTRTVFHFNFPRNLVFEKLFHNASLATPDVGESIAFVSSPLRTRVTQTFRTSLYPFSSLVYPRFLLLFVAFTHPSIHPSILPFPFSPPNSSSSRILRQVSPPPQIARIFPYSRGIRAASRTISPLYTRKFQEDQFRRFERVFQSDYYQPGRRHAR